MTEGILLPDRIQRAVFALCPAIEERIRASDYAFLGERSLRNELVACVLGSQVRHEMAVRALSGLESAGLLEDERWIKPRDKTFEGDVLESLSSGFRFPKTRARQLARTRDAVAWRSLTSRLLDTSDPQRMRQRFVTDVSGFGPKQASMFLRNIGWSFQLAILDSHVLRFMELQDLLRPNGGNVSSLRAYEHIERVAVEYASTFGYSVGCLDLAIWATMKAASELGL